MLRPGVPQELHHTLCHELLEFEFAVPYKQDAIGCAADFPFDPLIDTDYKYVMMAT